MASQNRIVKQSMSVGGALIMKTRDLVSSQGSLATTGIPHFPSKFVNTGGLP